MKSTLLNLKRIRDFRVSSGINNLNKALLALLVCAGFSTQAQDFVYANTFGSIFAFEEGRATATDANGNTYVTGTFFGGDVDFDPSPAPGDTAFLSSNGRDIFLAKYDANGAYVYAFGIGGALDGGHGIALDQSGNVYITGLFQGTNIDFDPSANSALITANGTNAFLAKYDATGTYVYALSLGGNDNTASGVAVDASGNAYITGGFSGTTDFDPSGATANLTPNGGSDIFLAKYSPSGAYISAVSMGGTGNDGGASVAVDVNNNVYLTGSFRETADFDPSGSTLNLTSNGNIDAFLAKYDASGAILYAFNIGGNGNDNGGDVTVDINGNAFITGDFRNANVDFDPSASTNSLSSNGGNDVFLAKYDALGNYVYAINPGGNGTDFGTSVAVDGYGNAFIAGGFTGNTDFDPSANIASLVAASGTDVFLAKYDTLGNYLNAFSFGGASSGNDIGLDVSVDGIGNVYLTGSYQGTVDFDPSAGNANRTSNGSADVFLAKYVDTTFVNSAPLTSLYVNDNNTAGDIYTSAVGNDANAGTEAAPFATISYAISQALSGDTIYVDAGMYNENVSVDKSITLLGAGKGATTIDGDNNGSGLGTIFLPSGGSDIQIGAMNQGFHVIGIDGPAGLEKAAIYLQGTQSNIAIIDNEIEARGDAALMGEYNAANDSIVIDNNHFTGQTFNGANPAGQGSGAQFTLPNVPRQAVVFGGGNGTTNTMNFTFTNNVISTVTGGQSITDNSGNPIAPSDQGNMLVTLDVIGTNLIQGNTFDGTTVSWYAALRTRGTGYTIDNNIFNGSYLVGMATGSNAVDASLNYWGDATGPNNPVNNPCGLGKYVPNNVTLAPFYTDAGLTTTSLPFAPVTNITQNTLFCNIQSAVDAANPTDTVVASAGVYTEQVEISKDLVLMGAGKGVTTILGSANMPLFFTTSGNNYPIVYVHDAANVIIKDLTVDGDGKGNSNYRYQGVGYSNAGGTLDNIEITNVIETPFNGNQHGIGLFADASSGTARTLTLKNSMIRDCQKNAISLSGADLTANVNDNIITGAGAIGTPLPAQNGIQFYGTAGGEIKNNIVKGFWYTPSSWTATGMLLYANTGNIEVDGNDLDSNDAHIYDFNGDATITNNDMKDGNYGIIAYSGGTNVTATISGNSVMDVVTGIGIYEASGTSISATINENSITNISDKAIESGAAATLDATCNWYGTTDDAAIQALLNGPINYTPFLNNGTDNNATAGFQPVPGSCVAPSSSDDLLIVSDAGWMMSTEVNLAEAGGYPWKGVSSLPATATYTLPAVVGQPYHYHSIDSVDGARTLRADNGVTFFRTTFNLAVDTGVAAHIISRMDDGMEIYINGHMIAREDDRTNDNWNGLPHNLVLLQNGDQDNGHNGELEFDVVNNYRLDSVVVTGENELVIALRNAPQSTDKGGFSFRMELKTGEAYMPALTGYLVSDVEWMESTVTTPGGNSYNWSGVSGLPAANTFTKDVILGQPYGWYSTEEVEGSFAIKAGADVTYYTRRFTIMDSADVNVRLRSTFDENVMIYVNDVLIASDYSSSTDNRALAAHDVDFQAGGAITNGNAGGDMFDQVETVDFNNILRNGDNYVTVALRNRTSDKGGFSLRLDMDKAGNPVIRKSSRTGNNSNADENELEVSFDIYPNPTNGKVFIDLIESPSADNTVTVLDLNGKVIMSRSLVNPQTGGTDIDLGKLANGMYIIRVKSGDTNYQSKRVMKF